MSQLQSYTDMVKNKTKDSLKTVKRPTSVDIINPEVNSKITNLAELQGKSTRRYVNDMLEMIIEKEEFIGRYLPQIKKIGFDENVGEMYLRDSKISQSPTIAKIEGIIKCDTCKVEIQDSCVHVLYAMTQPEIGRLHLSKKKK